MSQLLVNYSKIDTLIAEIDQVNTYFDNRESTHSGNARRISAVTDKRGNLASAVSELYSINNAISTKETNLSIFKTDLENFKEEAIQADQNVANRITNNTSSFCYTTGIGLTTTEDQSWWDKLSDGIKDAWDLVVDFYNEYKEEIWAGITLIADIAFCALAVVAFIATFPFSGFLGTAIMLAAGFGLAKSIGDVVTSAISFGYYCAGDGAAGERWANRGLKDGMMALGKGADNLFKTDVFENGMTLLYDGCNLFSNAVLFYQIGKSGKDFFASMKKIDWNKMKTGKKVTTILGGLFGKKKVRINTTGPRAGMVDARTKAYKKMKAGCNFFADKFDSLSFMKNDKVIDGFTKYNCHISNVKTAFKSVVSVFDGDSTTTVIDKSIFINGPKEFTKSTIDLVQDVYCIATN